MTGATLQAARDKGFHAIGIEQDPDYVQLIEQRMGRDAEPTVATEPPQEDKEPDGYTLFK